ncbi:MAG: ABC transporter permease [Longimicrobiales bacterium]|nr:ABC transporter permease [Longimicrobiales bacterium]
MIFVRNALRAPARSLMTSLGIAAGVGLFVGVTAITRDLRQQLAASFQTYGLEVVVYERRANSPTSSRISLAQMADLQAIYGAALMPLVMGTKNEPWNSYAMILGVTHDFLRRIPLTAGAPYEEGSGEILVGEVAAQQLGVREGQSLSLDGEDVRVSGIFRTGSRVLDGGFMMDIPHAQRVLTRKDAEPIYSMGVLRAGSQEESARLIGEVNQRWPSLRAIPGTEFAGALRLMRVVDAFVKTLAVVATVGTCLVVVITLLMAISERTREIGILMAVGWTPWLVLRMLFAETVALCVIGAALGNVLALAMLRLVNGLESVGFGWVPVRFPLSVTGASLVMALSVAVVSLAWPAVILYRVQPLSALRHE